MILGFGNNVVSALAGDITTIQTDIPVMPGTGDKFAKLLSADFENKSNGQRVYAKLRLPIIKSLHLRFVTRYR